jgi:regulator of sirC expression with transglutaminase-like and TPR domain
MEVVERFASVVAREPHAVALDDAALLIAAAIRPDVDVDVSLARLDELARRCRDATFAGLADHLFAREGFGGDTKDYGSADNSFLDRVLERRTGIPITLSVVMMEVGRRVGVGVVGIGMPAHFLVRAADEDVYCDAFNGGALLDADGCAALFDQLARGAQPFDPAYLRPVTSHQILSRMLNNLEHGRISNDARVLRVLLDLHTRLPGLPPGERYALASRLANVGRFDDAARVMEAGLPSATEGTSMKRRARAFRARLN